MSTKTWIGGAGNVTDVWTFVLSGDTSGGIYTITCNGKSVSFTSTGAGNPGSATSFQALLAASVIPEFVEYTWTVNSATITATSKTPGVPGTFTKSTSGTGPPTITMTNATVATGPNFWDNTANWSSGSIPANGDDIVVMGNAPDILYNIGQSAVSLNSLTIDTTGSSGVQIGLPLQNGNGYGEYRPQYLQIGITTLNILNCCGRTKIDGFSVQSAVTVHGTDTSVDKSSGIPALLWKGTNASNTFTALAGSVGIAFYTGEAATVLTLLNSGANVQSFGTLTLTTVTNAAGSLNLAGAITTLNLYAGSGTVIHRSGAVTTANVWGGTLSYQGSGTITTLNVGGKGFANFEDNPTARTVTSSNLYSGAKLRDRYKSVTWTNPTATPGCSITDVDIDVGTGRTYVIAG